jgi:hypothetical protein
MSRPLYALLVYLRKEAASLPGAVLEHGDDNEIADKLLKVADALVPLDGVPGVGPGLELLSDLVLLHFIRPRVVEWVAAARGRAAHATEKRL